jgi:uncharacterized protein YutE (UPF0331/DUF86 family)
LDDVPISEDVKDRFADRSARFTIGNTITLIYSMAYELVNDMLEDMYIKYIIYDSLNDSGKNTIRSQLPSYSGLADIMSTSEVIDSDQRDVIRHIREVRRALVHDVEERFTMAVLENLNEINRLPHLLNDLYRLVYEERALYYYDDLEPEDLFDG